MSIVLDPKSAKILQDILAKLDNPADPALVDITDKATREVGLVGLKAGTNNVGDVDVASLPEQGDTITNIAVSATTTLITPTGTLKVIGFFIYTDADIEARLNFVTSDKTIGGLKGQGAVGMNFVGMKKPQGASGEAVEITVTGTGNVKGWICTQEV